MSEEAQTIRQVLMTTDTIGGVWTYALELARALSGHDIQVALATMGAPLGASQRAEVQRIPGLTVCESTFKLEWMEDPWSDVRQAGRWLLQLEEALQPDIVHLNSYVYGALSWRRPTLVVGHSCVLSWWEAVKGEPAPQKWKRYQHEVVRGLHAADIVLAPTQAMLDTLKRHYGCFTRGRVVPNGRDSGRFPPGAKEPFILTVGRLWDEAKNVATLDKIATSLDWPVCVAGEDRHPSGGQVHYRAVREIGRLNPPELAHWLARAAIYALPARYEPFGLSVLEAGLAGCALVLGDIPSLRELWDDAAVFLAPDDAEGLAMTLQVLSQDSDYLADLAARARIRARQYTPQRMLMGYLAAYRQLLQGRPRSGVRQQAPAPRIGGSGFTGAEYG
jgi:glycosyltransferase involved in cell wall biosynthesis